MKKTDVEHILSQQNIYMHANICVYFGIVIYNIHYIY